MDEGPLISVIVGMYNSAAVLPGVLTALRPIFRGLHWNFVLVDDASTGVARQPAPGSSWSRQGEMVDMPQESTPEFVRHPTITWCSSKRRLRFTMRPDERPR
jgi:hypothetical protein